MIVGTTILVVWLAIGAAFGWARAKDRYVEYLGEFPGLRDSGERMHRVEAVCAASWTLFLWSLMGIFAGIAFAIWYFMRLYMAQKERK